MDLPQRKHVDGTGTTLCVSVHTCHHRTPVDAVYPLGVCHRDWVFVPWQRRCNKTNSPLGEGHPDSRNHVFESVWR
ncbi:unnamed protein product [Ectocarpus sp. CCAP 1310/34]|nr:unnamed protein product [Ectocarpus sp. CCAP 1310/34]